MATTSAAPPALAALPSKEEAAPAAAAPSASSLPLSAVIGFGGRVPGGLLLLPDDEHIVFPLGSTVVIKNLLDGSQRFLQKGGHDQVRPAPPRPTLPPTT